MADTSSSGGSAASASGRQRELRPLTSKKQPGHALTHWDVACALKKKGDVDGAIAEFREAIRLKPDSAHIHYDLSAALEEKGEDQSVLEEFRKAQELDPKESTVQSTYTRLLEMSKR